MFVCQCIQIGLFDCNRIRHAQDRTRTICICFTMISAFKCFTCAILCPFACCSRRNRIQFKCVRTISKFSFIKFRIGNIHCAINIIRHIFSKSGKRYSTRSAYQAGRQACNHLEFFHDLFLLTVLFSARLADYD